MWKAARPGPACLTCAHARTAESAPAGTRSSRLQGDSTFRITRLPDGVDVTMGRCRPPRPCRACRPMPPPPRDRRAAPPPARARLGADPASARLLGLLGIVATTLLTAAGRRRRPRSTCPRAAAAGPAGWRARWQGLGMRIGWASFQTLHADACARATLLVLATARASCRCGAIAGAIVAAHVVLLLGPPLISQDVFGYLGFARMGALHGLDPYTHVAARSARRRSLPVLGWPFSTPPTGRCSRSPATRPRRSALAGGLWAFKALARRFEPRRGRARRARRRPARAARAAGRPRSSG